MIDTQKVINNILPKHDSYSKGKKRIDWENLTKAEWQAMERNDERDRCEKCGGLMPRDTDICPRCEK